MKFSTFFRVVVAFTFLWLLSTSAAAQSGFGSYTSIDYDEASNTVMAYSETDADYEVMGNYQSNVRLTVTNDSGVIVADGSIYDSGDGIATIELDFAGEANRTYTAVGRHRVYIYQWDFDDYAPYERYYLDNWYFTNFESQGIYNPWSYYFTRPGYDYFQRRTQSINLGRTYDSVSTTATTCLTTYNKYYAQAKDYGGNYGKVNEITPISTAWARLKSASDATVNDPNAQVTDGRGNVYQKYNQTSTIPNVTLVGTISISSGPDSEKKLRFTKP